MYCLIQIHSLGLFSIGTAPARIVMLPLTNPEAPKPAIARPTMNMTDDFATPQSNEPSSNVNTKAR